MIEPGTAADDDAFGAFGAAVPSRTRVAIVGGGAAGALTAIHLALVARQRRLALAVTIIDPAVELARGTAYGTSDPAHLLNVPAAGMTALPDQPEHFVTWRSARHPAGAAEPGVFAPRVEFGRYLQETLTAAYGADPAVHLTHIRARAVAVRRAPEGVVVETDGGHVVRAAAVVLATGDRPPRPSWAPADLRDSAFFVSDPWAPGALDIVRRDQTGPRRVLLVGTGLTMVDLVLSLTGPGTRADRRLLAVSRHGALPQRHAVSGRPPAIPEVSHWGSTLGELDRHVRDHLLGVERRVGDWRPGMDGVRMHVADLWQRLGEPDRLEFLRSYASEWGRHRHRMPSQSADALAGLQATGRLRIRAAHVTGAEPLPAGGLRIALSDGTTADVGWVVNCTGTDAVVDPSSDPLYASLLTPDEGGPLATLATAGMGVRTRDGRLLDPVGRAEEPIWTLGAIRRGELWESTAVPEIRTQAAALASAVITEVASRPAQIASAWPAAHTPGAPTPPPRARPRDVLGLPLSTTAAAAAAFNDGLDKVMRVQAGAEERFREAVVLDPDFAVAHAALAMLGHEAGVSVDVAASLAAARDAAGRRADERERNLVEVVGRRVDDVQRTGAAALLAHIDRYPRDVLAVSAAVPTIAFSGVTDIQQDVWDLVERLRPAYGDHWWYVSLRAFTLQDQSRFDEAGELAEGALACEPTSGHAVHAQAHVLYETGKHDVGRAWLDEWVAGSGQAASHRAHFAWHAALHELAVGDTEAVRRRYYTQLAPPVVTGVRALVDSASLLWRWSVTTAGWDAAAGSAAFSGELAPPPLAPVLDAVAPELVDAPRTPFVAMHAALALAGVGDSPRLARLRRYAAQSEAIVMRTTVAAFCDALIAAAEQRWGRAADLLSGILPGLARVGGSAAQREIVDETLLFCLVSDGQAERALRLLDERLDRRTSPLDQRRRDGLFVATESART